MRQFIAILLTLVLTLTLAACSKEKKSVSFEDSCWEQVEDCKTTELDDGTVSVTLTAPDYTSIIYYLEANGVTDDVTVEMLHEIVKDNPEAMKEYTFIAESDEDEAIRDALMEQVAYELLIIAMGDMEG